MSLLEEKSQLNSSRIKTFKFIGKTSDVNKCGKGGLKALLKKVRNSSKISEQAKQMVDWNLEFYQNLALHSLEEVDEFLKQKLSKINEKMDKENDSNNNETKAANKLRAEQRRAKLISKFNKMQTNFLEKNKEISQEIKNTTEKNKAEK